MRWVPEYESYVLEQWRQGSFGDFWKKVGIYAEGSYDTFPEVPVALLSSWYDAYVRTTFDNYEGLSRERRASDLADHGAVAARQPEHDLLRRCLFR